MRRVHGRQLKDANNFARATTRVPCVARQLYALAWAVGCLLLAFIASLVFIRTVLIPSKVKTVNGVKVTTIGIFHPYWYEATLGILRRATLVHGRDCAWLCNCADPLF